MPKLLKTVNAFTRENEYPGQFYVDNGLVFCKSCCHSIKYEEKSTIDDHLKSKKHLERKRVSSASKETKRQLTIETANKSASSWSLFVKDFVKMCVVSNIPLEKTKKMTPFLNKYCKE